jgi:hypothetical protein
VGWRLCAAGRAQSPPLLVPFLTAPPMACGLFLQSVAAVHSFRSLSVHDFVSTRSAQLHQVCTRLEPSGNAAAAGRRAALASGLAYQIAAPVLPRVAHVGGGGTRVRGAGQGSHQ